MSEETIKKSIKRALPAVEGDADDCPVIALGQRNGVYYFLSAAGEIRDMKPRDMTALGLLSLFNGETAWLFEHHAKLDRKNKPTGEIDHTHAAAAMMRRCASVGLWLTDMPRRSVGVWRDPEGAVIAHCGDALVVYAAGKRKRRAAGVHLGYAVYVAAPAIEPPADTPATRAEATALLHHIRDYWIFAGDHLPRMVFGFIALAMLGAAPSWRVHILLIGKRGGGKSTLLRLIRAALGPQANYTNDPTEAGLRELLSGEARAIVFDEAGGTGGEDKTLRVDAIVGLLRRMSDDQGARSIRGTGSGAKEYVMAGAAALAAVNAPTLDAQDRSRILEVDLLPANPDNKDLVEQAIAAAGEASPALRARALAGWERFLDNFQVYRQALITAKCDSRQADQLGTLFAAAEMMTADDPIDSDTADLQVERLKLVIEEYRAEDEELSNARKCHSALMTTQIEHWKGGSKSTIGRLVQLARAEDRPQERDALRVYGLRLERNLDGKQELWIANQHRGLEKIFHGTDWYGGGWRRALLQLPGAFPSNVPMQFDGHKARFIVLPERLLPEIERPPDPL